MGTTSKRKFVGQKDRRCRNEGTKEKDTTDGGGEREREGLYKLHRQLESGGVKTNVEEKAT